MTTYKYNPIPTRVWSRTQAPCTYFNEYENYDTIYVALNNTTVSRAKALYDTQMLVKGNVLQYKKNSSNITKMQRYSQICKGKWTNRTISYATQTETYTNPNIKSLKRINAVEIPPNDIPGLPNNISGPYQTNVINPFLCSNDSILSVICCILSSILSISKSLGISEGTLFSDSFLFNSIIMGLNNSSLYCRNKYWSSSTIYNFAFSY